MPICVCMGIGELLFLGALGLFTLMGSLLGWDKKRKAKKAAKKHECCKDV